MMSEGAVSFADRMKEAEKEGMLSSISSLVPIKELSSSNSSDGDGGDDDSVVLTSPEDGMCSREALRRVVHQKQTALTPGERNFLNQLSVEGREEELELAKKKLLDPDLFSNHEGGHHHHGAAAAQPTESAVDRMAFSLSALDYYHDEAKNDERRLGGERSAFNAESLGSEERQKLLEVRRKSSIFGKIWKTHEKGLTNPSIESRRRSLMPRSKSLRCVLDPPSRPTQPSAAGPSESLWTNTRRSLLRRTGSVRGSMGTGTVTVTTGKQDGSGTAEEEKTTNVFRFYYPEENDPRRTAFGQPKVSRGSVARGSSLRLRPTSPSALAELTSIPSEEASTESEQKQSPEIEAYEEVYGEREDDYNYQDDKEDGIDGSENDQEDGKQQLSEYLQEPFCYDRADMESLDRIVLMKRASVSIYGEEGIEVADLGTTVCAMHSQPGGGGATPTKKKKCRFDSILSNETQPTVPSCNSFDETMSFDRVNTKFNRESIHRSQSEDELVGLVTDGLGHLLFLRQSNVVSDLRSNWDDNDAAGAFDFYDEQKDEHGHYDTWSACGQQPMFRILGTSSDDLDAHPHVLSPPLMEGLRDYLPFEKMGENFWLKYSMVRDGASVHSFLKHSRGSEHTILALETVDGEVFGSFTSERWRPSPGFYGRGASFLWRMRHNRKEHARSVFDQVRMEGEIDVFRTTPGSQCIQLCKDNKVVVGGGMGKSSFALNSPNTFIEEEEWGFGISIEDDFIRGSSYPCITYGSPSLSTEHSDGSLFEIINIELWTLSPCHDVVEAERMELSRLFLQQNLRMSNKKLSRGKN